MTFPDFRFESTLWQDGCQFVAGVDEVGRGALAGPVVTAAVVFPPNLNPKLLMGINDSKLLTAQKRNHLVPMIYQHALFYSLATIPVKTINRLGITNATFKSMRTSIQQINSCDHVLVDGFRIPFLKNLKHSQTAIVKGDRISLSIAAASILAKVHRDQLMTDLHQSLPHFHWKENKGYGTLTHRQAIKNHGASPHHRTLFIRKILSG